MASDSQILALSTMFTEDVFAFYGGKARFGERVQVQTGRIFVVVLTLVAYADRACSAPHGHFRSRRPVRVLRLRRAVAAAGRRLFWQRSTKWGALAVDAVGRVGRDLHVACPRRSRLVRPHAGCAR